MSSDNFETQDWSFKMRSDIYIKNSYLKIGSWNSRDRWEETKEMDSFKVQNKRQTYLHKTVNTARICPEMSPFEKSWSEETPKIKT